MLDFEIIESYRLGINFGKKAISSEKGENSGSGGSGSGDGSGSGSGDGSGSGSGSES